MAALLAEGARRAATDPADADDADKASCWAIDATNTAPEKLVALELLLPDVADFCSAAPISETKCTNSEFNGP